MLPFAYYMLKVIICSSVLYGYYWFFLRNKIFHSYNRFYLLATIVLSLILPLLKFNVLQKASAAKTGVVQILQVVNSSEEYMDEIIIQSHYSHISKDEIAIWIFIAICIVFASIFVTTIFKIYSLKRNNPKQYYEDISMVYTKDKRTPFSFLKNIFWNDEIDINSNNGKRILKHELAHVKEKHSHDKLFTNIVLVFFWCNPIFWLIRKELNMIHEFIADKKAVENGDTAAFAAMILQATYPGHRFELANHFFYSHIKRRLSMLTKNKTKVNYISRLLVLPLTVIVFAAFTLKAKTYTTASLQKNKTITVVIDAGHGGTDHGATAADGTLEKDIVLSLAKKIQELNKSENINILLVRDNDIFQNPAEKAAIANKLGAELFVSIHVNAAPTPGVNKQSGLTTWVVKDEFKNAAASKLFASSITAVFTENYQLPVASNPQQRKRGITVLQQTNCPAVLIEAGCITNEKDFAYLKSTDGQEQFARNILNAITNFVLAKESTAQITSPSLEISRAKQPSSNNGIAKLTNPTVITDIEGIIRIEADTFQIDKNNSAPGDKNTLIVIDGKEFQAKDLYNKKIVAKLGLLYPKNDMAMLKKYGDKASNGVLVLENTSVENLISENKKTGIASIPLDENRQENKNETGIFISGNDNVRLQRLINMPADEKEHTPIYFINGKQAERVAVNEIDTNHIDHALLLLSADATTKYGEKGKYGAVEITLKKDATITLSGMGGPFIKINKLKNITAVKYTDPDYQIASAAIYFSGEGFPAVILSSINEGSLRTLESYMKRIVPGSIITLDNVYISKKDGSNKIEIQGKSFGFYDKNVNEIDTSGHSYDIFTKVEDEPCFPGGNDSWQAYLKKNINPAMPVAEGWKPGTYTVVVSFIVDKQGNVSDVTTSDFANSKTALSCINLIKDGPKWIPGKQQGKVVNAYRKQPITFVVSED